LKRYRTEVKPGDRAQIKSSKDAYNLFFESWIKNTIEFIEEFKVMLLNRANRVLGIASMSKGSTSGSIVDIKVLFQYAIKTTASTISIAHNHPSGTSEPSDSDRKITKRIYDAGNLVDIKLLDHIIVLPIEGFLSFADNVFVNEI
jgi:DNA repair protein RadC